jgi:hypothetical protein
MFVSSGILCVLVLMRTVLELISSHQEVED